MTKESTKTEKLRHRHTSHISTKVAQGESLWAEIDVTGLNFLKCTVFKYMTCWQGLLLTNQLTCRSTLDCLHCIFHLEQVSVGWENCNGSIVRHAVVFVCVSFFHSVCAFAEVPAVCRTYSYCTVLVLYTIIRRVLRAESNEFENQNCRDTSTRYEDTGYRNLYWVRSNGSNTTCTVRGRY